MQQVHIFIKGEVQGVGFRQFVVKNGRKLGLTGWVRNLSDGRVEGLFQGEKKQIETLLSLCRKGPFLSVVESVSEDWTDVTEQIVEFTVTQ
jgi:acylphosphatase